MVEPRVYQAMAQPVVGHLDEYFFQVLEDVKRLLQMVFETENSFTMAMSATGSGGMETAVTNFTRPGDKFAIFANGYFCDRMTEMAKRHGASVVRCEKPWGETFTDDEARDFIKREKPALVGYVTAETSTGAWQEGAAICEAAHEVGALVIADCVTSLGAMPVRIDKTGIDIAYSCSQKGLACPPGLSPVTVSPRAMERLKALPTPATSWYFDLKLLSEYLEGPRRYHHTAPISMFYALREALAVIAEEGLQARFERHRNAHLRLVAGLENMGLAMHVAEGHRLWSLNTPRVPEGVSDLEVRKALMAKHGIEVLGGFGPLAGKVFRIGLMGVLATAKDVDVLLEALRGEIR
jgi:alanine-glyoxylate transaminase/serine-glyoxylate transaminase/serine-pyruvate transaminase